eukprot:Gb_34339 [translate_table: standard]
MLILYFVLIPLFLLTYICFSGGVKSAETVIYRIFYYINRSGNGHITLRELKRGNLIPAMQHVDEEEDINKLDISRNVSDLVENCGLFSWSANWQNILGLQSHSTVACKFPVEYSLAMLPNVCDFFSEVLTCICEEVGYFLRFVFIPHASLCYVTMTYLCGGCSIAVEHELFCRVQALRSSFLSLAVLNVWQIPRKFTSKVEGKMGYEDFVYFMLSEEDKSCEPSLEYCVRFDGSMDAEKRVLHLHAELHRQLSDVDTGHMVEELTLMLI